MSVSILIPCHNAALHLRQCLESAIIQQPDEIILLDDGSTDDSLEVAHAFGDVVRIYAWENQGAQATRNELFRLCTGDWVQYLDADDYLYPGKIAAQLEVINTRQIGYCDFDIDRGNGIVAHFSQPHSLIEALLRWEFIPQTNALLFPAKALAEVEWDEAIGACHEHKLIVDLLKAGWEFKYTPFAGFLYRQNWDAAHQINLKLPRRLAARAELLEQLFAWVKEYPPDVQDLDVIIAQTRKRLEVEQTLLEHPNLCL